MGQSGKSKVLIAGGGVAALEAALALKDHAGDRVEVQLLAPETDFSYRPMAVAEPFRLGNVERFELASLATAIGATHTLGALVALDDDRHVVRTSTGEERSYDQLLVACGAIPTPAIPGALTFRGPVDGPAFASLLGELARGEARSVAFALPWGPSWPLPVYELALLTARHLEELGRPGVELTIVTPERQPLQVFGQPAGNSVRELLDQHGISLMTGVHPTRFEDGELALHTEGRLAVDRVVALPRLVGPRIGGLPQSVLGFVSVDSHCRVVGLDDVYAAGDIVDFPVKQGGIAAEQADAAADAIAAAVGTDLRPEPFRPVLRGMLLTGREPRYLRRELPDLAGREPELAVEPLAAMEPLWWPPAKIVGRYLAPFLAAIAGAETPAEMAEAVPGALPFEVEIIPETAETLVSAPAAPEEAEGDTVAAALAPDPVVVAPEDTIGEVAELLLAREARAAVVAEYGRVIGIVTATDLARALAARVHPSDGRARQWMTADPVTVTPRSSLAHAALLLREYGIAQLPVVDGEQLVGLLPLEAVQQAGAAEPLPR